MNKVNKLNVNHFKFPKNHRGPREMPSRATCGPRVWGPALRTKHCQSKMFQLQNTIDMNTFVQQFIFLFILFCFPVVLVFKSRSMAAQGTGRSQAVRLGGRAFSVIFCRVIGNDFSIFYRSSFHCPQIFYWPQPYLCSGVPDRGAV